MNRVLLYTSGIAAEKKPTGGELRFLELAQYLAEQKQASLCCADDEQALKPYGLQADLHMKSAEAAPSFLPEEARLLLANRSVLKQIAKSGYEAVIVFDVPPAVGLTLYRVRNQILMIRKDMIGYEKVKTSGGGWKKHLKIAYQWICEDICLRHAKQVICQCAYDRDVILNRHPLKNRLSRKFEIQINNCNPEWIRQRAETAEKEMVSDRFRVGLVGGFDDLRKGQSLFLKAAEYLTAKYPDIEFVLVGGGKNLDSCRKQYESERIQFQGRMENPLSVTGSLNLLTVPSLADSCPNTVMEALYTGVPVVGSRAGGIPEILIDENALFKPDWKSLAEKIETCYLNPVFLHRLQEKQTMRKEELSFNWAEKIFELIMKNMKSE